MFQIRQSAPVEIIMAGRLDATHCDAALKLLNEIAAPRVIDLARLEYIASAGLCVILLTQRRCKAAGSGVRLINVTPPIYDIFHYAGVGQIPDITRRVVQQLECLALDARTARRHTGAAIPGRPGAGDSYNWFGREPSGARRCRRPRRRRKPSGKYRRVGAIAGGFEAYSRYVSPWIEEALKAAVLMVLIRTRRVGLPVDAAIAGFAIGMALR